MFPGQRKRGWRQCLADSYEKNYGPLDDPVPTFGAKLVTFPSTPTLPMCFATPDPDFLEQLDRLLHAIEPNPVPKCLQRSPFYESAVEMSCSDNDTDDEVSEGMRESIRQVRVRMYAKIGIDIIAVEARRQERRERRAQRRQARAENPEASAAESNSTKPALHDHAITPSSNTTEADAALHQAKNQKRKRQTEDEQDQPQRKVAKPSDTTTARPKRRIRPSFKPQASYSPPQTPSPTERKNTQGQPGSLSSPESPIAQQPTPEVDNSSCYLKFGRGQESPTAEGELSAG
ncbi:uncharacterized protein FPRO_15926 [Fusarium proliferatum ET1]|uniref:Uncharacterized protein n=1 Tax=Fusarium proliferatum (strain ET1) TaxID=1227346 RepID=A0A1L7WAC7_FUSPR|nr:uncharacterized protein FPRO_15926 [Fusarium proliferatum ET1]CZR49567.1 uncharacterized protein FPRO_15926 [Fusarium proliferatum ET1]